MWEKILYNYLGLILILLATAFYFLIFNRTIRDANKRDDLPWYVPPLMAFIYMIFLFVSISLTNRIYLIEKSYTPCTIIDVGHDKNGYLLKYEYEVKGKKFRGRFYSYKPKCVDGKKSFERCNGQYFLACFNPGRPGGYSYILWYVSYPEFSTAKYVADSLNANKIVVFDDHTDAYSYHRIIKPAIKKLFGRKE